MALGFMVAFIEDSCKSSLDFGDFLLFFFFEFFMNTGHVLGGSFLFHFLEPSQGFEVLFFGHFSGVNISHDILFILLESIQRLTEFQNGDSTILVTNGSELTTGDLVAASCVTDFDRSQRGVRDLV